MINFNSLLKIHLLFKIKVLLFTDLQNTYEFYFYQLIWYLYQRQNNEIIWLYYYMIILWTNVIFWFFFFYRVKLIWLSKLIYPFYVNRKFILSNTVIYTFFRITGSYFPNMVQTFTNFYTIFKFWAVKRYPSLFYYFPKIPYWKKTFIINQTPTSKYIQ